MTDGDRLMWYNMLWSMHYQIAQLEAEYCHTSQPVSHWELEQEIERLKHDVNYISGTIPGSTYSGGNISNGFIGCYT